MAKRKLGETAPTTRAFDKVVFLDKPYDEKEMVGIVRRMILAPIIAARKHPRHDTNEQAEVQVEGTGGVHKCLVRNISKGDSGTVAGVIRSWLWYWLWVTTLRVLEDVETTDSILKAREVGSSE